MYLFFTKKRAERITLGLRLSHCNKRRSVCSPELFKLALLLRNIQLRLTENWGILNREG